MRAHHDEQTNETWNRLEAAFSESPNRANIRPDVLVGVLLAYAATRHARACALSDDPHDRAAAGDKHIGAAVFAALANIAYHRGLVIMGKAAEAHDGE